MGTGRHSVQVEGPGYLPIGISKQDIWETGLQHVQSQEGGFLHHLEEKGPRQMRTPGRAYLSDTLSSSFSSLGPLGCLELQVNGAPKALSPPPPPPRSSHTSFHSRKAMWPLQLHYNGLCAPPQGYIKGSDEESRKESLL